MSVLSPKSTYFTLSTINLPMNDFFYNPTTEASENVAPHYIIQSLEIST